MTEMSIIIYSEKVFFLHIKELIQVSGCSPSNICKIMIVHILALRTSLHNGDFSAFLYCYLSDLHNTFSESGAKTIQTV